MKTKTYDLNLYVIDGVMKVVAYELERNSYGDIQTNCSKFHTVYEFDLYRRNEPLWRNFLDFFGEKQLYSELDSWYKCNLKEYNTPNTWYENSEFVGMPPELAYELAALPEYEVN